MRVLVTGSEGFVGQNLVPYLHEKNYEVLSPSFAELDLTNSLRVKEYLAEQYFDVIVHCATADRVEFGYANDVLRKNLSMFFNLYQYKESGTKLINLGSGSEYNRQNWIPKMAESYLGEFVPEDDHSYAKFIISNFIDKAKDANLVTLRLFGIYGPFEDYKSKFISNCIAKVLTGLNIEIYKNVYYDYVYIDDFCEIVNQFILKPWQHTAYNITSGKTVDLLTLANHLNTIHNKSFDITILNDGLGVEYSGCNNRLMKFLEDFQFTSHKEAITKLYRFYEDKIDHSCFSELQDDSYLKYAKSIQKRNP